MAEQKSFENFNNGLTVAFDKVSSAETVAISFLVKTGARHEKKDQSGISHFLEHMAFKGTKKRTAQQIAEEFDMIGGYLNAYTSREVTVYYSKVLKSDVKIAFDILTDILQNSSLTDEMLEKERQVILEEISQCNDSPDTVVFQKFDQAAFPNQPMGRSILGERDIIKKINRDQLQSYIDMKYGFNNIIVSVAGNFEKDQVRDILLTDFKNMPIFSVNNEEKAKYIGGDIRTKRDLEQIHTILGFEGVSYYSDDYYTQKLLAMIVGGGMSSRLFQEVREKRGLAYHISASTSTYTDTGIFEIYSSSSQDKTNELIDVVIEELHKLTLNINEQELQRAKAQLKTDLLMSQENMLSRAQKFAYDLAIDKKYNEIPEIITKIDSINIKDVMSLLKTLLTNNKQPTISSIGNIPELYQYDSIVDKFKI